MAGQETLDSSHVQADEEEEEEVPSHTCKRLDGTCAPCKGSFSLRGALDPRAKWIHEWNRVFLLVCATGLAVDPLFFYALSISDTCMCLFIDGWFAITVTALRCMMDMLHVWNMWLQLKMPYGRDRSHAAGVEEGAARAYGGSGGPAMHYLRSKKGFFFDLFVVLPVPQVVLWVVAPALIAKGSTTTVMTVFLIMFLFQYLPKIYHSVCLLRRMQNISGYIFGTIWWGIALNMIAYFVASHAAGACWYLLGIQRATKCLTVQCGRAKGCVATTLGCEEPIYYGAAMVKDGVRLAWGHNSHARSVCISSSDNFDYGAFKWTVPLVTNTSRLEKILFPIFWGLMTLSTFGNLESTTEWLEVLFNIIVLTSGLLLVTMLIGNIKASI